MRLGRPARIAALSLALLATGARRADPPPPQLGLPLACRIGVDCAVQNYPDDDPGAAPRDHMCRGRTYAGHNGTDFRIPSIAAMDRGVPVLAAAPGRVLRVRDGVPDISIRASGAPPVEGQECGNGLVIDNRHGWQTQYCHLMRGSLMVKPGRHVRTGTPLGYVGLSGDTEFPHVHLTVRHDGAIVDPFAYGAPPGSCGGGRPLWRERIAYQSGEVLVAGFATRAVELVEAQRDGAAQRPAPTRSGPALVAFVQAIGLERGDVQRLSIHGPDARVVAEGALPPLERDKAQAIISIGRKTPAAGWPAGVYQGDYAVYRDGRDVIVRTFTITL